MPCKDHPTAWGHNTEGADPNQGPHSSIKVDRGQRRSIRSRPTQNATKQTVASNHRIRRQAMGYEERAGKIGVQKEGCRSIIELPPTRRNRED